MSKSKHRRCAFANEAPQEINMAGRAKVGIEDALLRMEAPQEINMAGRAKISIEDALLRLRLRKKSI